MKNLFINNVPAQDRLVRAFIATAFLSFTAPGVHAQQGQENASQSVNPVDDQSVPQENNQTENPVMSRPDTIISADQPEQNTYASPHNADGPSDAAAAQSDSVVAWLDKMTEASKTLNFQAAFVVSRLNQETVPYLWRHGVMKDGSTMEQLSLQNGPGRELIRVDNVVSVFVPDAAPYSLYSESINSPIPNALLYSPASLMSGYEFVEVGRARVAGRTAQQLRIVSRDGTRFSYQLWLDEQTGMLLKFNTLDLQGNMLEQIQVTTLEISDSAPEYFAKVNRASLPKPISLSPSSGRGQSWEVEYLPVGMVEVKQDVRRLALTGQVVEYKMFSDGLVDVSVYVQPAADAVGSDLVLRHELSTFLTLTDGKAQVTVVGEIPLQTANAIATSLRLRDVNSD